MPRKEWIKKIQLKVRQSIPILNHTWLILIHSMLLKYSFLLAQILLLLYLVTMVQNGIIIYHEASWICMLVKGKTCSWLTLQLTIPALTPLNFNMDSCITLSLPVYVCMCVYTSQDSQFCNRWQQHTGNNEWITYSLFHLSLLVIF